MAKTAKNTTVKYNCFFLFRSLYELYFVNHMKIPCWEICAKFRDYRGDNKYASPRINQWNFQPFALSAGDTLRLQTILRPILLQLDLQSVEKVPFSTFAWAFAPKTLEISLPRLRMSRSFLQIYSELFPATRGTQLQEITAIFFSIPLGQIPLQLSIGSKNFFSIRSGVLTVFDPVGSKKCWWWFFATGPLEKRETASDRSWRKPWLIVGRGRPASNIFGANAHANKFER